MRDDLLGMLIHEATRALARAVWRPLNAYLKVQIEFFFFAKVVLFFSPKLNNSKKKSSLVPL
jgi:hypothetical protein